MLFARLPQKTVPKMMVILIAPLDVMVMALFSGLVLSVDKMMVILIAPLDVMALSVDKKK